MKLSAGLLMFRRRKDELEFFLVHPGGPYFKNKDLGYWTIPKGEPEEGETLIDAAQREFNEETGILPSPPFTELGSVKQKGGKKVYAWAFEKDSSDPFACNFFQLEWPPRSGKIVSFPEADQGLYFSMKEALEKINPAQADFILRVYSLFSEIS
ncbi:MAG: NUDIX domain-containing protein [Cytophagaceae bacterium]